MEAILIIMGLSFIGTIWFLICNLRTYNQRIKIIDWVHDGSGSWQSRSGEFNKVSYDQHLWALFLFRDPKKLYHFSELNSGN